MKFAVIGGDMRQVRLSELLALDGHQVSAYALDKMTFSDGVVQESTARKAVSGAGCIVLPLPVSSRDGMLNAPLSGDMHTVREILSCAEPGQIICAGRVDSITMCMAREQGLFIADYFDREELAVANAVATAEGAVKLIMEETPITLCGSKCLVIGYGRIGKILSHRLRCLGAEVTVSARKFSDFQWIRAFGCTPADTGKLKDILGGFDIIVNTVPARILGEELLRQVRPGSFCIDLASKPGGMDFAAASRLGVKAMWALSLPGEIAPATSGESIKNTVYNILQELEAPV